MTPVPLDFSLTEKPALVQENMIAYMRLFAGLSGVTVRDADTFWIVSHKPAPGNVILRARWPQEPFEERIDETFEQIGQLIEQIDWLIFPNDQPADLGARLEARGMPGGLAGNWMWADLTDLCPAPDVPSGFRIERVQDDAMLAEWVRASEEGFGEGLALFYNAYARHGYGPDAFSVHYTGYLEDQAVTSGTLLDAGGSAAVYDVSTLPEYRRKGYGGALTHALMQEIRRRGYSETWIWSSDIGKSVYAKLGYVDADFGAREHKWQRR